MYGRNEYSRRWFPPRRSCRPSSGGVPDHLIDHPSDGRVFEALLAGVDHPLPKALGKAFERFASKRRSGGCSDVSAAAHPDLDRSLVFELAVGAQHGVGVDWNHAHDLLHRRELIAGPDRADPHRMPDLVHELDVDGNARSGVQMEDERHSASELSL